MSFPQLSRLLLPLALGLPLLTGACGVPLAVSGASYGADGVSLAGTGKTGTDHLASIVSKKDCALWRVFRNQSVCREREEGVKDPYSVDYATPNRISSDSGIEYEAPARSGSDAPAFAWDASAYGKKAAETPSPAPMAEATTQPAPAAVADSIPPQVTPAAPTKTKKATHARSVEKKKKKKPAVKPATASAPTLSPDQAAPAL